jgi:hypothetical protein
MATKLPARDLYVGSFPVVLGSDGSLYQKGVKITASAADLNALGTSLVKPLIEDGDQGCTIDSADQTNAKAVATIPNIGDAADTFVMNDTAATLTNKTLTTPIVASFYQDAGKTKLMTTPNTASDTLCAIAATQTLTNKTLTAPVITNPATTFSIGTHDYGAAAADWTLSAAELLKTVHKPTNASGEVNAIIADTAGILYIFINGTGKTLTVKGTGTGIAIANGKVGIVMSDGTNVIRVSTDA